MNKHFKITLGICLILVTHLRAELSTGLISSYNFETSATDNHGDNDCSVEGAMLTTGRIGNCYSFDGIDDRLFATGSVIPTSGDWTAARFFNNVANWNLISYKPRPAFRLIETDLSKRISVPVSVFLNSLFLLSK